MYATVAKIKQLHYFTRLNKELQSDITNPTRNDYQILQYIMTVQNITAPVKHWTCLNLFKAIHEHYHPKGILPAT